MDSKERMRQEKKKTLSYEYVIQPERYERSINLNEDKHIMKRRKNWETRSKGVEGKVAERQNAIAILGRQGANGFEITKEQKSRINSLDGRVMAVKIIAAKRSSPGRDDMKRETEQDKLLIIEWRGENMNRISSYKPGKRKKVEIPKPGTKEKRILKIPMRRDRVLQTLYLLATDPLVENESDLYSFGFRKGRSTNQGVQMRRYELGMAGKVADTVFETDIEKCFDRIFHKILREKTPNRVAKARRNSWLEAGTMDVMSPKGMGRSMNGQPGVGTPQGSVISPMRCNVALNGRENYVNKYHKYGMIVKVYRYADDLVRTVREPQYNILWAQTAVKEFLRTRGRTRKESKTKEHTRTEGFDFLGWNIKKTNQTADRVQNSIGKVIELTASKTNFEYAKEIIRQCVHKHNKEEDIIQHYNTRIGGWCNYFATSSHMKPQFHDRNLFTYERRIKWSGDHGKNQEESLKAYHEIKSKRVLPEQYRTSCAYPSFADRKKRSEGLKRNPYRKQHQKKSTESS